MAAVENLFRVALDEMGERHVRPPERFDEYLARIGARPRGPAPIISVQGLDDLRPELREAQVMVFRCGADGGRTSFALSRSRAWPDDYFLMDSAFEREPPIFLSRAPLRELFVFSLLRPVERTLINLALTSGATAQLLDLDNTVPLAAGATGSSTYDFSFKPHSASQSLVGHRSGQVDIDALILGTRDSRDHVFVIEAKYEDRRKKQRDCALVGSLAKHKLLFPVLAIRHRVPSSMPIVPIYLRAVVFERWIDLHVAECSAYRGGASDHCAIDEMNVSALRSLRLQIALN